jgi:hypothetical protein
VGVEGCVAHFVSASFLLTEFFVCCLKRSCCLFLTTWQIGGVYFDSFW